MAGGYGEKEGWERIKSPLEERIKGMSTPRAFLEIGLDGIEGLKKLIFRGRGRIKEATKPQGFNKKAGPVART